MILLLVGELSFDDSHDLFRGAFTLGFPWEVLKVVADFIISIIITMNTMMKVFSGPPNVVFTWRHWGHLEGSFQDNQVGGILHHVASRSNLKSARAQRFPTLNGNYSNSHLEHDFPTHTEAHCHLKQSGHIQESWRLLILCLELPIDLLARQSSI